MELSINTKLEIQHLKVSIYHLKQKHFFKHYLVFFGFKPPLRDLLLRISLVETPFGIVYTAAHLRNIQLTTYTVHWNPS